MKAGGVDERGLRSRGPLRRAVVHLQVVIGNRVESLPPSCFALVMATGILSISSGLSGLGRIAACFFAVGLVAALVSWTLVGLRLWIHGERVLADLNDPTISPGFFTMVAGTAILGRQCVGPGAAVDAPALASALWVFALLLWLVISYAVFTAMIVRARKPAVARSLNGVWLIAAVATQSISVLGTKVAAGFPQHREPIMLLSLVFHLMGCMLYLNIIAIIFYRMTLVVLIPVEMTPLYWINMGAAAITTQAGATLILDSGSSPLVTDLVPFLKGITLLFWSAGTWWVPLLVALGVWTHVVRRVPVTYTPQVWGIVFPIGMYTASTDQLAQALGIEGLLLVPQATIWFALLAWGLAFAGLVRRFGRELALAARD